MANGKIAAIFCEIGFVLCMVCMVLGPFNIVDESIAAGVVAGGVALVGMHFAFRSWNEPEPEKLVQQEEPSFPQEAVDIVYERTEEHKPQKN